MKRELNNHEVTDSESLKNKLDELLKIDSVEYFTQVKNTLLTIPEDKRKNYIENIEVEDEFEVEQLKRTSYYIDRFSFNSTKALDCSMTIVLSICGNKVGYLTKREAWDYKLMAAKLAQQCYTSWEEYVLAFYAGYYFNCESEDDYKDFVEDSIFKYSIPCLFTFKHSPINKIDWNGVPL